MSNPVGCWAPEKERPNLPLQRIRQYDYVYAATCPKTGDIFSLILPGADTECMQVFLEEFQKYRQGKPTVMIMDQAAWHKSGKLSPLSSIWLEFLPPYSPELNPVEQLRKHIRTNYTYNHVWKSLIEMEDYLCDVLNKLSISPATISAFSLFDWMIYV